MIENIASMALSACYCLLNMIIRNDFQFPDDDNEDGDNNAANTLHYQTVVNEDICASKLVRASLKTIRKKAQRRAPRHSSKSVSEYIQIRVLE